MQCIIFNFEVNISHPNKQRLPPLHALQALDAFARLGTVWEAAEELGITRSAVSHRLSLLESALGFELAARSGKGVALTPRGRRYAEEVRKSLALLAEAHGGRDGKPIEGELCISSTPGFASMWLCNHVASFHEQYPNLTLRIITTGELDAASERGADLFIVYGDGNWPHHTVQHLYDVEFLPMCSPALKNMYGGLNRPADVRRYPMLHLRQTDEWREWLAASDLDLPRGPAGVIFSDLMLVQTAAIAGQGIMMGDEITCAGALASGQLVAPFSAKVRARGSYYLLRIRQRRPNPAMLAFTRWLNALFMRVGTELRGGRF
jgi:LysR family glycine cleavage system transcriptional activator